MKRTLLTAAMLLTFGVAGVYAQSSELTSKTVSPTAATKAANPQMMASMRANRLEKELQLTPEQKQKATDIFMEASQNPDKAAARKEADAKIVQLLTPEQAEKYQAMKNQRQEAVKEKAAN